MFPGMILSGQWTRLTFILRSSSLALTTGLTNLSIVPGEIVDSITIIELSSQISITDSIAPTTKEASITFVFLLYGVGTAIIKKVPFSYSLVKRTFDF